MHVRPAVFQLISKRIDNVIHKKIIPRRNKSESTIYYTPEKDKQQLKNGYSSMSFDMTPLL